MMQLNALMRNLNYHFNDIELLQLALTHRSKSSHNYERLEFLGDSILGFVIAEWLYQRYPSISEGRLSRMRSSLVRKETLAMVARSLQLSDYLILGEGELKSGGFNRASILADVIESLIGAIYLDSGFTKAKEFILTKFEPQLSNVSETSSLKDSKSKLQEYMQKHGYQLPIYKVIDTSGKQHEKEFTVECSADDLGINASASAWSRRSAEQCAAKLVFEMIKNK